MEIFVIFHMYVLKDIMYARVSYIAHALTLLPGWDGTRVA
jgi:hypothetical protein